jgi:hypothetical protein
VKIKGHSFQNYDVVGTARVAYYRQLPEQIESEIKNYIHLKNPEIKIPEAWFGASTCIYHNCSWLLHAASKMRQTFKLQCHHQKGVYTLKMKIEKGFQLKTNVCQSRITFQNGQDQKSSQGIKDQKSSQGIKVQKSLKGSQGLNWRNAGSGNDR